MLENLVYTAAKLSPEIRQMCREFAVNNTMMNEERFSFIAASILSVEIDEQDYLLEIGTFHGNTAAFMAKLLNTLGKKNPVVSVDSFGREGKKTVIGDYTGYMENIRNRNLLDQCFVISAYSDQAASVLKDHIPFILIDGNHFYEVVKSDIELYLPKLKVGGIAFLDDNIAEIYPGVPKAIHEYLSNHPNYEILVDSYYFIVKRIV